MYFTFPCPQCEKKLKVRDELRGRRARCPYCKSSVAIPQEEAPPEEPATPPSGGGFPGIDTGGTEQISVTERARGKAPARPTPATAPGGAPAGLTVNTDVNMLISGAMAAVFTGFFYVFMWLIADWPYAAGFAELFRERGWVPYVLVFLMGWSMAVLVLKSRKLKRQRASMLFDLLPNDLGEINQDTLDNFVSHLRGLPSEAAQSFLVNRVRRGLEHFRVRKSAAEVATVLSSQSDIDANSVESSYTLLKVFIWAIPIMGFIGTVLGISEAVGGFSGSLDAAAELSALKESLGNVTGGLATAFDTTLVALVMSILVMFPSSSMQKSEEDLLNWVDEYCNENLLKRLNDGREGSLGDGSGGASREAIKRALDAAMAPHHGELRTWTEKLESIGSAITNKVVEGWEDINKELADVQRERLEQILDVDQLVVQLRKSLTELTEQTEDVRSQSTEKLEAHIAGIERGLSGLNNVLENLGQERVVVEMHRPRRRWWPFGASNGG